MSDILAVFPGTFDPITLGHLDVISRASRLFDRIYVAAADSPSKHTLFSLDDRLKFIEAACANFSNVKAFSFRGMLVDFLNENHADILIRGIRTAVDFDYERQLFGMYRVLMPNMEIVMLPAENAVSYISSSMVREVIIHHGDCRNFLPAEVVPLISSPKR